MACGDCVPCFSVAIFGAQRRTGRVLGCIGGSISLGRHAESSFRSADRSRCWDSATIALVFVYVGARGFLKRWTLDAYTGIEPLLQKGATIPVLATGLVVLGAILRKRNVVLAGLGIAAVSWAAILDHSNSY